MKKIFCDFDGTITNRDSIVFLTEYFGAGSEFRGNILRAIKNAEISVFEAIRLEMETVKVSWEEAARALKENIHVSPNFPPFVDWVKKSGREIKILSSGMEPVLELFIGDLGVQYYAHRVAPLETGWIYKRNPAHDKEKILEEARDQGPLVFIGDGTSDVSAIPYADLIFAREGYYLADHCTSSEIPHIQFSDFDQIRHYLEEKTEKT